MLPLNEEELARHTWLVESIRTALFRKWAPADYHMIDGSERIIPPRCAAAWLPEPMGSYRAPSYGGISYGVVIVGGRPPGRLSVSYSRPRSLSIWISGPGDGYTMCARSARLRELDLVAYHSIQACRGSLTQPSDPSS